MTKRRVGALLVGLAAVLAAVGFVLRAQANDSAADERRVDEFTEAISGVPVDSEPANQVPATVAWVLSVAALACGVIFLAARPD